MPAAGRALGSVGQPVSAARVARHLACQALQGGLLQASFCIGVVPSACRSGGACSLTNQQVGFASGMSQLSCPGHLDGTGKISAGAVALETLLVQHCPLCMQKFSPSKLCPECCAGWDLIVRAPLTVENLLPMPVEVSLRRRTGGAGPMRCGSRHAVTLARLHVPLAAGLSQH